MHISCAFKLLGALAFLQTANGYSIASCSGNKPHPPYCPREDNAVPHRMNGSVEITPAGSRFPRQCTVYANGGNVSDVPNLLRAFEECNHGGHVVFPEDQNYFIGEKLNPVLYDVTIEWRGWWTLRPDIAYWANNQSHYYIHFQNHVAAIVFSGDHIWIDGYGTGGIFGNGNLWYEAEKGNTVFGRPMAFVFWNVSDVTVNNFKNIDPPFWSTNIMNGTDMYFNNLLNNATAPGAPYGENWVQNTDGFDTMNVNNIYLTNFVYQGGDDCNAIKDQSYNVFAKNVTCIGGNGIAVGSLGQYLDDASVANYEVDGADIYPHNGQQGNAAYIKTWIGVPVPQSFYESCCKPRGGGWGSVRNLVFRNFRLHGPQRIGAINQDSGDTSNGTYAGTSNMEISNVVYANFTGFLSGQAPNGDVMQIECSKRKPCFNIALQNITATNGPNTTSLGHASCEWTMPNGVYLGNLPGEGC